eukprot:scaffold6702_cov390-Prasinococcus_capsulatus_cf.AAC.7
MRPSLSCSLLENILVIQPSSPAELVDRIEHLEGAIITNRVKLLVVDSIASLFRSQFSNSEMIERQKLLGKTAAALKYLAETFTIPVVVTNQVTTRFKNDTPLANGMWSSNRAPSEDIADDSGHVKAALGVKWAHCVNTRIVLTARGASRTMKIAKSPMAPSVSFDYVIKDTGLFIEQTEEHEEAEQGSTVGNVISAAIGTRDPFVDGVHAVEAPTGATPGNAG